MKKLLLMLILVGLCAGVSIQPLDANNAPGAKTVVACDDDGCSGLHGDEDDGLHGDEGDDTCLHGDE